MASVGIAQVRKAYGQHEVIHGIDIDIMDEEFVVLVGPSGCGKSTLLRMVAGLEDITSGTVRIGGRVVNDLEPRQRDIAMVFQNYALYPHMSVRQNLAYGLKNRRTPKAEIDKRVAQAAEILQIGPFLDRKPRALSGGQRQRVAMGRAIVREPAAFLFDEPLSNLDAKLRVTMRVEIKELHNRLKTTIVYVTHDQIEAMTMADKIVVMRDGRVEQIGAPLDLYDRPESVFVAGFIGSPAMNLISSTALPHLPGVAHAGTIGIRPEDLTAAADGPIEIEVLAVEELGAQRLVHGQTGGERLTVTLSSNAELSDSLRLDYRPGSLHLFTAGEGRRID